MLWCLKLQLCVSFQIIMKNVLSFVTGGQLADWDDLFHSTVGNLQVRSGYLSWNLPLIKIFISVLKWRIKLITPSSGEFLHVSWSLCVKSSPPLSFHTLTSSSTSVLVQETTSEVTTHLFNQTFYVA